MGKALYMGHYKKKQSDDLVNSWFTNIANFQSIAGRLLKAETEMEFEVFLEKAMSIDKRSTCLFIEKHQNELPKAHLGIAKAQLSKYLT
ncbi:hypothetical protein bpr_II111 (plasmid) [Butyrivibrio proteoclasticus B316]|uniref:Uncharacterized protein n=1 Tax=Butyrivibrio proteoclasticus (strain ATCC 51982 / DSM 14932 / B316) TaxID=515622 RepID=E0S3R8_BUTPB|nr:hypothetical protein [Butyrivibrio proteoclasticus]ADL36050.1 hypothetical protein bpr_II111 [Butyrivibrio proteoclasticus B316]